MAVSCRLFRSGKLTETGFDPAVVSELLEEPDTLVWVDVDHPTPDIIAMLGEEFGFHPLALEDCLHPHQRPKIEAYGAYYFLVAYGVSVNEGDLLSHELAAFVGRNYLVTIRKEPVFDLKQVSERWEAHPELCKEGGGYLLYILLDEIVDGYFDALDRLEDVSEEAEGRAIQPEAQIEDQRRVFAVRKELLQFRRWTTPLREVLDVLQRRMVGVVTPALEPYYRDVYDHAIRTTDYADNLREILSSALDAYLAVASNRLNEVMKSLTSWAAIILVPTLIAGIYGMNFIHMPELQWRLGYPFALSLMVVAATTLYFVFKRRKWL